MPVHPRRVRCGRGRHRHGCRPAPTVGGQTRDHRRVIGCLRTQVAANSSQPAPAASIEPTSGPGVHPSRVDFRWKHSVVQHRFTPVSARRDRVGGLGVGIRRAAGAQDLDEQVMNGRRLCADVLITARRERRIALLSGQIPRRQPRVPLRASGPRPRRSAPRWRCRCLVAGSAAAVSSSGWVVTKVIGLSFGKAG